jgi:hypothetical protein
VIRSIGTVSVALAAPLATPVLAQTQPGIPGVLAPGVEPELVQVGCNEGPVGATGGSVYFSNRDPDRSYHPEQDGNITIYKENTGATNGIAFTRDGDVVRAEGNGKKMGKVDRAGNGAALTEGMAGCILIMPNDLIVDARGGVYFTYPGVGPVVPGRPTDVFSLPPGTKDSILIDGDNPHPNGITLTSDGKTLIVDNTRGPRGFRLQQIFLYPIAGYSRGRGKRRRYGDRHGGRHSGVRCERQISLPVQFGGAIREHRLRRTRQAHAVYDRRSMALLRENAIPRSGQAWQIDWS